MDTWLIIRAKVFPYDLPVSQVHPLQTDRQTWQQPCQQFDDYSSMIN